MNVFISPDDTRAEYEIEIFNEVIYWML